MTTMILSNNLQHDEFINNENFDWLDPFDLDEENITDSSESNIPMDDEMISLSDSLLLDDELIYIQDLFSEITNKDNKSDSNIIRKRGKKAIIANPIKRSLKPLIPLEKFHEFSYALCRNVNNKDLNETVTSAYELMHHRCLVRFKASVSGIAGKAGPESLIGFYSKLLTTFCDGKTTPFKQKIISHDENYYIVKSKGTFVGTEASLENSLDLLMYICPFEDISSIYNNKEYVPNRKLVKCITTLYVDIKRNKIVLYDMGMDISTL